MEGILCRVVTPVSDTKRWMSEGQKSRMEADGKRDNPKTETGDREAQIVLQIAMHFEKEIHKCMSVMNTGKYIPKIECTHV